MQDDVRNKIQTGAQCVKEEWKRAFDAMVVTESDMENLEYVLSEEAGSSQLHFQNGWRRDCDERGEVLASRLRKDGTRKGMRLADFEMQREATEARLTTAQVIALRLYTTDAFRSINTPLRDLARTRSGDFVHPPRLARPHPLPCTVVLISDGLKKLRKSNTSASSEHMPSDGDRRRNDELGGHTNDRRMGVPGPRGAVRWVESVVEDSAPSEPHTFSIELPPDDLDAVVGRSLFAREHFLRRLGRRLAALMGSIGLRGRLLGWTHSQDARRPLTVRVLDREDVSDGNVLWRGMRDMQATERFMKDGGSELAPCSTTFELEVALRYARDWTLGRGRGDKALIFRVRCENFLQKGSDLSFLSAFPREREALYPPITLFKPLGPLDTFTFDETQFIVLDVRATVP